MKNKILLAALLIGMATSAIMCNKKDETPASTTSSTSGGGGGGGGGGTTTTAPPEGIELGNTAPVFTLKDSNGASVSSDSFKGSYVLIAFYNTWCGVCFNNFYYVSPPYVSTVDTYEVYKNKKDASGVGLKIIGVYEPDNSTPCTTSYLQGVMNGNPRMKEFPQLLDCDGSVVKNKFGDPGSDNSVVVLDPKGVIIFGTTSENPPYKGVAKCNPGMHVKDFLSTILTN